MPLSFADADLREAQSRCLRILRGEAVGIVTTVQAHDPYLAKRRDLSLRATFFILQRSLTVETVFLSKLRKQNSI